MAVPELFFIFFATPAVAISAQLVSSRRRRQRLNRTLHELRRPLQAMALGSSARGVPGGDGFLDLALAALGDLDRIVNGPGGDAAARRELVSAQDLVVSAIGRWRATDPGSEVELFWDAGEAPIEADPGQIARALDNLFANWHQHGGPRLVVTGSVVAEKVRITLADSGRGGRLAGAIAGNGSDGSNGSTPRTARDPRHGHGLEIVGAVARGHGGRFALSRSAQGAVAALELPLARGLSRAA
jgi:signal transduction histidine kinase